MTTSPSVCDGSGKWMTSTVSPFQWKVTLSSNVSTGSAAAGLSPSMNTTPHSRPSMRRSRTLLCATIVDSSPNAALPPA